MSTLLSGLPRCVAVARPGEFRRAERNLPMEAYNDHSHIAEDPAIGLEVTAEASITMRRFSSLLDKLLILLMIAVLLALSLPAVFALFLRGCTPATLTVRD